MAKENKKRVRGEFRDAVFRRDRYRCRGCGFSSTRDKAVEQLDAHHITDRHLMPNGGYVAANGISLCAACHEKAEVFHATGVALPGWAPADLYEKIGSSEREAIAASHRLVAS